jgi:hypothetical protein
LLARLTNPARHIGSKSFARLFILAWYATPGLNQKAEDENDDEDEDDWGRKQAAKVTQ